MLAGALGAALILRYGRNFYWSHAVIIGSAVGAVLYTGFRTMDRLRELHRRR